MAASSRNSTAINTAIATLLALLGFLLNTPVAAGQSMYCAFEVTVHTPSGTSLSDVPVALIRVDKTMFSEAKTDTRGIARLCDAPLQTVDVAVGSDVCGSVLVRALKAEWPETHKVNVTYVRVPCDHLAITSACQVLLRVEDDSGRPVPDARFRDEPAKSGRATSSDALGRLFRSVRKGTTVAGVISKPGLEPSKISLVCLDDAELKVVLHKK